MDVIETSKAPFRLSWVWSNGFEGTEYGRRWFGI